jgi:hypothetical protein
MTAKRKKIYTLLLGLGAAAFGVDRFLLSEPVAGPAAALAEDYAAASQKGPVPAADPLAAGIPELPFPMELQRYSPAGPTADLFAAPARKGDAEAGATQTDNPSALEPAPVAGAHLSEMLQGVYVRDQVQYAILGGRPVKRGENIDGCTLTEISGTVVKFLCVDREVIATVPTSAGVGRR